LNKLCLSLALLSIASLTPAQALPPSLHPITPVGDDSGPPDIPLRRNSYELFTVNVSLGRQFLFSGNPNADPLPFIFDTGANKTAVPRLIASQLIDEDELEFDRVGHGMTEQFLTDLFFVDQLNFGWGDRSVDIAVIEESYGSILSAAGILGSNAFQSETLIVDFPGQKLMAAPDLTVRSDLRLDPNTRLILGEVRIRGIDAPVQVMIDTGSEVSLVNSALADLRRGPSRAADVTVSSVTDNSDVQAEERRVFGGLELGNLCMGAFWVTVLDAYVFQARGWQDQPAMVLGMDALKHTRLSINYDSGAVAVDAISDHVCAARSASP